jgi:pectinesterase
MIILLNLRRFFLTRIDDCLSPTQFNCHMKRLLFLAQMLLLSAGVFAQSRAGLTGVRDSSYNLEAEYNKHRKNFPDLKMVPEISENVVAKNNIPYCVNGERKLLLDVFSAAMPPSGKMMAIIMIHGGGWRSGNRSMHHPLAQRLSGMGYVCFTPEYRLSTEALYPAAVHDLKAVVRWVKTNAAAYHIDPNQIVVAGHSAGGELAAFLGATNNDAFFEGGNCNREASSLVNAVIDMDGLLAFIHPESGEGDDSKRTSAATYWFGYSKTERPDIWDQASPLTHAGPGDPPILFINSSVDRMHAGREDFIAVMNKNKIYTEVVTFKGSPHSFILFNPWFDSTVNIIDAFIRRTFRTAPIAMLGGSEDKKRRGNWESDFVKNLLLSGCTKQFHSIFPGEEKQIKNG